MDSRRDFPRLKAQILDIMGPVNIYVEGGKRKKKRGGGVKAISDCLEGGG